MLYPEIKPHTIGRLSVSTLHEVVYQLIGPRTGAAVLFLHGGPGVGVLPDYLRLFDPSRCRVVLPDQRGSGRSTPRAELHENTLADLVSDLEKLRVHLRIEKWLVVGGSWGSLLGLCYAITHPRRVSGLVLRGVFLGRKRESEWFYGAHGVAQLFPDEWEKFIAPLSAHQDPLAGYRQLLFAEDAHTAHSAAAAWIRWETSMNRLTQEPDETRSLQDPETALSIARIQSHYLTNSYFLPTDNYILDNARQIAEIPCHIVQGRFDTICPATSAWDLHKSLPGSHIEIVPNGAHSPLEDAMSGRLIEAIEISVAAMENGSGSTASSHS